MGFTSQSDLINQKTSNGKEGLIVYQKTLSVAQVAGTWTDMGVFAGFPVATDYPGTSLTYVPTDESSLGAIPHGGNVATATKHLLSIAAQCVSAAGAPWVVMMVDQLGYVPITGADVTGTASRTVTMTALGAGARYPFGDGCRAYFSCEVAPTLGGPNITAFTYTNSASVTGRAMPGTVNLAATPVAGQIPHSGNAANRFGPFLPMASGDTGIADLESFTLSTGTAYGGTGQLVLHLVRPLLVLPVPQTGILTERDLVNQLVSMPRIRDGAYLKFLLFNTGATAINSPFLATGEYAFGG